ncbi:MAG: aminotransferase class I/II-fold pyridoxal phosphate-dependent enzyme [Eubacterium sp.]
MKLDEKLNNLNSYPFHMPGHKRRSGLSITGESIDVTEIYGLDNLHSPTGVIKEIEDKLTGIYNSEKTFISVNGSTCGVLSAISAVCKKGDEIIIAANCHKSVYNACVVNGIDVYFITPEYNVEYSCWGRVTQKSVDDALKKHPNACAVVITSPTYEGFVSEIKCSVPLIVDSAHGAHFGLSPWLPERPNGDITVMSLHKTLPALTQTAVVNVNNKEYIGAVKKYLDIFETSSPSYVLLDSVDKCADFLDDCEKAFDDYKKRLDDFYKKASFLDNIDILENDDKTRIIVSANGYSGVELENALGKCDIEAEGSALKYIILISTVCDTQEGFDRLYNALSTLEKREGVVYNISMPVLPEKMQGNFESDNTTETALSESIGKICAEYVYAYPPGCPILVPGQVIKQENIDYISALIENDVNVLSDTLLLPLKILTKQ